MKSSKLLMSVMVVVVVLSFTITTVGAQSQVPPVGELDEDGDLIMDIFQQVNIDPAGTTPFEEAITLPEGSVEAESIPSYPVDNQVVYTKYPTFEFSQDTGALKYRIEVYNLKTDPVTLIYTIKGTGNCAGGVCTLTPILPLKPFDLTNLKGYYGWWVQSKTASGWGGWSTPESFYVLKNGFESTFTTLEKKWWPVYGTWVITSSGYAKTLGETGMMVSAIEKHLVSEKFVYEVKMKRKYSNEPNEVYFQAYPLPLNTWKRWDDGYIFRFQNNGDWALIKYADGSWIPFAANNSPYINAYDWNKITIFRDSAAMQVWINEQYVFGYLDTSFSYGYVGFGMLKNGDVKDPLLVDWARLEYSSVAPYPTP